MATTPLDNAPVPSGPISILGNPYLADCDDKERAFIIEYPKDFNATAAARRAGGWKSENITGIANDLLNRPHVQKAILYELEQRGARVNLQVEQMLHELSAVTTSDITNYEIDDYGNVQLAQGAPPHATKAIASIKKRIRRETNKDDATETVTIETELRLWNKVDGLNLAMKHLGMFVDRKIVATGNITEIMRALNGQIKEP